MPTFDSLLLNYGGGIIGESSKSKQFTGSAALLIGIGGTGVAALSELRGKVYQQLIPDNPQDPVPCYDAIQFLGIDSDDTDYQRYKGNCHLRGDEFFSIKNDRLADVLKFPNPVKNNSLFNWMEIDRINALLCPDGAGGIRQVGRYLLLSKVASLDTIIQSKCASALKKNSAGSLDVYVFAGISGGTGSGCFLDVCYIVRRIIERNGWNGKIMGYFFLPDVVTSKDQVANNAASVAYNNFNGYAAMKELDYLMSLRTANDRFCQEYTTALKVDTQQPPVDMCHLISACKSDGSLVPNGFEYGIHVAADYAMAYLADVDLTAQKSDNGLTMRGHLANVTQGVQGLPRQYGANPSYHVLGASNAEIPMREINTYLACGFYEKFLRTIHAGHIQVQKHQVKELANGLGLSLDEIHESVTADCESLYLHPIDLKVLASSPMPDEGKAPETWVDDSDQWKDSYTGTIVGNANALSRPLEGFRYENANSESLIGRVFRKLWEISENPEMGPYCAVQFLNNNAYDLTSHLVDCLATIEENIKTSRKNLKTDLENMEKSKADFHRKKSKKCYELYKRSVADIYETLALISHQEKTAEVLRQFKLHLQDLYTGFFKPLQDLLDNLKETFEANKIYLDTRKNQDTIDSNYTWSILTLDDIKPHLDDAIKKLTPKQLITDFIGELLKNSTSWIKNDHNSIALQIRMQMLEIFREETNRSLQDYLFTKYPEANGDATLLAQRVNEDILERTHTKAQPMFWCSNVNYQITSPTDSFASSSLSVPGSAAAVCAAAADFQTNHKEYAVRQTGIGDRIFALRFFSGIPLYAYQGITLLKEYYDRAIRSSSGAGLHLYAKTGRGKDITDKSNWQKFLPTPLPYSKARELNFNTGAEDRLLEIYRKGEEYGIIHKVVNSESAAESTETAADYSDTANSAADTGNPSYQYFIRVAEDFEEKTYTLSDFSEDGDFIQSKYDKELARLEHLKLHMFEINENNYIPLKSDGTDECSDRVRLDYFIHYPLLWQTVEKEVAKYNRVCKSIDQLKTLQADRNAYDEDMKNFCNILFHKHILCENNMGKEDYSKIFRIYCTYTGQHQVQTVQVFSDKNMTYGSKYPLFQAFETYRSLDPKKAPRKQLDLNAQDSATRNVTLEDLYVPYDLEKYWTSDAMELLLENVHKESEKTSAQILRFYHSLVDSIISLKKDSPIWPDEHSRHSDGGTVVEPPKTEHQQPRYLWDHQLQTRLIVYPQYGYSYAYNEQTQAWVSVRQDMLLWNEQLQSWVPVTTDTAFFRT